MIELHVTGMTCGHCESAVARAARSVDPGVNVTVDRARERVMLADTTADTAAFSRAIEDEGYRVEPAA